MAESLRDRVEAALLDHLLYVEDYGMVADGRPGVAHDLTAVVFDTLNGARPCVTCGKSIGPAKVAKGYVQCYGCSRSKPVDAPIMDT